MPLSLWHEDGGLGLGGKVGRHNLNAVFVEDVLNVAVQTRQHIAAALGGFDQRRQLVAHVKIFERRLQHGRFRRVEQALGPVGGGLQHGLDQPPGGVVADRDSRGDGDAFRRAARVIADGRADEHRVGNGHFLAGSGHDLR